MAAGPTGTAEASREFEQALPKLVVFVSDKFALDNRFACPEGACKSMETAREFTRRFGDLLLGIYGFDLGGSLTQEATPLILSLVSRGIKPDSAASLLQAWILAIQCLLKRDAAERLIPPLQRLARDLPCVCEVLKQQPQAQTGDLDQFFNLLMAKDRKFAAELILSRIRGGDSIEQVYGGLLLPALEKIRLLWLQNRASAVDERAAADICRYIILRVVDSIFGERRYPFKAMVACMPGEQETLGAEVLANFLAIKGWSALFLGSGIPPEDIMYAVLKNGPQAVVLSSPSVAGLPQARSLAAQIREKYPQIKIAAHGRAALLASRQLSPLVDLVADDLEGAHEALLKEVLPHA